jgi:hypothetical protein
MLWVFEKNYLTVDSAQEARRTHHSLPLDPENGLSA